MVAIAGALFALILPAMWPRWPRRSNAHTMSQCRDHLQRIAGALRSYNADFCTLPPAFTVDDKGNPLHSWRTLILPYLDQHSLYKSIDLSKPWDDPVNAVARKTPLECFQCPSGNLATSHTTYLALVGPRLCFPASGSKARNPLQGLASGKMMLMEVSELDSVPWMAPYDSNGDFILNLSDTIHSSHVGEIHFVLGTGRVQLLSAEASSEHRSNLLYGIKVNKRPELR